LLPVYLTGLFFFPYGSLFTLNVTVSSDLFSFFARDGEQDVHAKMLWKKLFFFFNRRYNPWWVLACFF
jgi:hypothetical protein